MELKYSITKARFDEMNDGSIDAETMIFKDLLISMIRQARMEDLKKMFSFRCDGKMTRQEAHKIEGSGERNFQMNLIERGILEFVVEMHF